GASSMGCRTIIAWGAPRKAGTAAAHGAPLGAAEIEGARKRLNWPNPPFEVPEPIRARWQALGGRGAEASRAWRERLARAPADLRREFERRQSRELPARWRDALAALK